MRNICCTRGAGKCAVLALMMLAVTLPGWAQKVAAQTPATATQNLARGVTAPVSSNVKWNGYSVMNLVPGSALFSITSANTVFYLGFTAGTTADVSNMVLYTTPRGSLTISAVTPVKLGGISNPSINLSSTSVCPAQPLSAGTPCIVRLDPVSVALTTTSDYYLTVYFTDDTNNQNIGATAGGQFKSSFAANYFGSTDYSHLTVGQTIPAGATLVPYFLMYVMNN